MYDERDHARFCAIARVMAKHGVPTPEALADLERQPELGKMPWTLPRLITELTTPRYQAWFKDFQGVALLTGQMQAYTTFGKMGDLNDDARARVAISLIRAQAKQNRQAKALPPPAPKREEPEPRAPDGRLVGETELNQEVADELAVVLKLRTPRT